MRANDLPESLGEFRVSAVLGHGGSGIVYDAWWGPRRVAVKVLHPTLAGTPRLKGQFLSEARRLQLITHPAVVKVLGAGELPDGRPYLAMEHLAGETLASVLARGALPIGQALSLFGELCGAVAALHAQGLVHRDLKPENVFIVGGEHAVLLDFGIAKELEAPASTTTQDGHVRGTPAYMAPERFFGQAAGVATDVYELALVLYAMLAGRLPWDDLADPEARLSPKPLAGVPGELDVTIRRALSSRAQNRPASATALLQLVQAVAGDASAAPPSAAETARMKPEASEPKTTPLAWAPTEAAPQASAKAARRGRLALVGAGALAVAGTGAIWAWRHARPEAAPPAVAQLAPKDDPWAKTPPTTPSPKSSDPAAPLVQSGDPVPVATARAELARALQHVPADTHVVLGAVVGELRGNEQYANLLAKLAKQPRVQELMTLAPCVKELVSGSEWLVFAAASLSEDTHGTLIVRGRWQRSDVEACLGPDLETLTMQDGAKLLQFKHLGWIDFVDDHTVYLSVREDLAAAQVHDLAKAGKGPTKHAAELLAGLPSERALTAVVDGSGGSGGLKWPTPEVPAGSDAAAWVRIEPKVTILDVAVDTHDAAAAQKLVGLVKPELEDTFKESSAVLVGKIEASRDQAVFRIRGRLTALTIAMLADALP
jgi:eukaryotic-like serine/threonine-protein kinase